MPEVSRFFESTDYSQTDFAETLADLSSEGIYQHADGKLAPSAPGGLIVNIAAGRAIVQGFWYRLTTVTGRPITPNGAPQIRWDRIVLRLERGSKRVILAIREGVAGSGGAPALQRAVGGDWEISLCAVRVGPGVSNIASTDIVDERGYADRCGWAGQKGMLGPERSDDISNMIAISPLDPNTGFQWPQGDTINVMVGGKVATTFMTGQITMGMFDASWVVRSGGTGGAGRERIYVDSSYIILGRDADGPNTGPANIYIGTSASTTSIVIGAAATAGISIQGQLYLYPPAVGGQLHWLQATDGYQTGWGFRNPTQTKQFLLIFGTGGGQGFGGSGDVSMYTVGSGAGIIIMGTHGQSRFWMAPTYFAFGSQTTRTVGFNFQQQTNDTNGGIHVYHTDQGTYGSWHMDVNGRIVFAINGVHQMWIHTQGTLTVGGPGPKSNGFNFQQYQDNPNWGVRIYHTDQGTHVNLYADPNGRLAFGVNDNTLAYISGDRSASFGGAVVRTSGFNYHQPPSGDVVGWGYRLWHSNSSNHVDWHCDAQGRSVLSNQDTGRIHIGQSGHVTIGPAAADVVTLNIAAGFADGPQNGIRVGHTGGVYGQWWVHSNGLMYFGHRDYMWTFTGNGNIAPPNDNVASLGADNGFTLHAVWSHDFYGEYSRITTMHPPSNTAGGIGASNLLYGHIYVNNAYKPGGGDWSVPSDERLKVAESIRPFDYGIDRLMQMEPIWFQYNGDSGMPAGQEYIGFSAQALEPVVPEMVSMVPMRRSLESEEEEDMRVVDTTPLMYMLLNALKEHETRLRALEGKA